MTEREQPSVFQALLFLALFALFLAGVAAANVYFERIRIEKLLERPNAPASAPFRPRR